MNEMKEIKKMNDPVIGTKVAELILSRPDFINTVPTEIVNPQQIDKEFDEDFSHEYAVVDMKDDKLIVMSFFNDRNTTDRTFHVYDIPTGTLEDADEETDEVYREMDNENPFFEDDNVLSLVSRDNYNVVKVGEHLAGSDKIDKMLRELNGN